MNLSCGLLHWNIILEWPDGAMQDEMCFISIMHVVCYIFSPGNVELDIVLHIHYDKPVKVPLMLLLVWENIALGYGLNANIALSFTL